MHISQLDLPCNVQCSCILEFDGASKGNPGQAGAGAVLRAADGSTVILPLPSLDFYNAFILYIVVLSLRIC